MNLQRNRVIAMVVASLLMIGSGVGYRTAAARMSQPLESAPLPAGRLAQLPLQFGDWKGEEAPLSTEIAERTDSDQQVNRVYINPRSGAVVGVFVAYGLRMRDLVPHRPEVCYPGAGWTLESASRRQLKSRSGRAIECQVYEFFRGGLQNQRVTVLHYYIIDGASFDDVAALRSLATRKGASARYVARVQLTSLREHGTGDTAGDLTSYAEDFSDYLIDLLPAQ